MKISTGGLSISTSSSAADASSVVTKAPAADPYPPDWVWSADFAAEGTAAAADGHGFEWDIGAGPTEVPNVGVKYTNHPTSKALAYFGIAENDIPSKSSNLKDGVTGPGGKPIDLVGVGIADPHKFLTIYFQIDHASDTTPASVFGPEFYWSAGTPAQYNRTPIAPHNSVRKTGSHEGTVTTAGTYADGEYISVSYEMTDADDFAGNSWDTSGLEINHIGGSSATFWAGGSIIVHGYVLSPVYNNDAIIHSVALPIRVS